MKVEWIEYKGKNILNVEYCGARSQEELIEVLHREVEIERQVAEPILCLVNVSDAHAGSRYMDELKRLGKEVRSRKVAKTATLGVVGIQKVLYNTYVLFTGEINKLFDDETAAKDWLVQ